MRPKRVLLVFPEFHNWRAACMMGFLVSWALEQGFEALGIECTVLPGIIEATASECQQHQPSSWLRHAREVCKGKTYDQVWIEACHLNYDENFLEWLATLAPVRVGFVAESLTYSAEVLSKTPYLARREEWVVNRLKYFTHAMLTDDRDVRSVNARGIVPTLFWCLGVPSRYIHNNWASVDERVPYGVFFGTAYGERKPYLEHPKLQHVLVKADTPEWQTEIPRLFDSLGEAAHSFVEGGNPFSAEFFGQYINGMRVLRTRSHEMWLQGLARCAAVVALPQLGWCFSNRPYDALAVGRPVVNFRIKDNPIGQLLFEEGKEILFYSSPEELASHLDRLVNDAPYADEMGRKGQERLMRYYTLERRISDTLKWIETGEEPIIGGVIRAAMGTAAPTTTVAPKTPSAVI